jgi:hypothetical protein
MLADALLRSLTGSSAMLRVTNTSATSSQSEMGIVSSLWVDVVVSPVVRRSLRPEWRDDSSPRWELLVSASSVQEQVGVLQLSSAQSLFELTLAVTVGEQSYLIESFAANEAFGQVYLYRLLLREAKRPPR